MWQEQDETQAALILSHLTYIHLKLGRSSVILHNSFPHLFRDINVA